MASSASLGCRQRFPVLLWEMEQSHAIHNQHGHAKTS